ncbi:helix-turn-helix domain-containing protein [Dorea sp. D27]|uniref:helix-turn-helix domain-containing protein n=1 Tax=Dorea sp. D27 TaxID=658665 RepID=UPI0006737473|nr:AraC family transcriptional regulator [Dorea sp. D27]KMZ52608.1 transposon Tn10 TetD protein [Dorea sp. D27]
MEKQKDVVQEVIDYIETNLEEKLDLDHIAEKAGYSKFYLNRIFAEYTGVTIHKYLQNRRLTVAAEKLVKTDKPIIEIAYDAGYDTQQSFSYAFKQVYLYPPKVYRDMGVFLPIQSQISMSCASIFRYYKHNTKVEEIAA